MLSTRLRTVAQIADSRPTFSESGLRWHLFNSRTNGLEPAIVRIGRRVLIDEEAFDRRLEGQRNPVALPSPPVRRKAKAPVRMKAEVADEVRSDVVAIRGSEVTPMT